MKTDDFEKRLQRVPQRNVPDAWRAEVLANAKGDSASPDDADSIVTLLRKAFLLFIHRPHGMAWSGVAAAWALILLLNFSAQEGTTFVAAQTMPSPDTMQALQKQKRFLLAELNGLVTPAAATRPQPPSAGPRSNRKLLIRAA